MAGLLATGAGGGSVRHGLHDAVVALRLVDGTGAVHALSADDDPARFLAAGVAMGLLGVVSTMTLQCVPRFDVIGSESTSTVARAFFDLCGSGAGSLEAFLRDTEYARVLWWPQRGVDKLVVWQARRMVAADYGDETGAAWALRARPYRAFDPVLGSTLPLQAVAGAALSLLGGWRSALSQVAGPLLGAALTALAERIGLPRLESALIDGFVPEDRGGPKRFWDSWHRALPMDDEIDERLLPTAFTEIWLPLEHTGEAMRRLRDLYRDDPAAAGSFVTELYAAGPSPFWMSPAHGGAMLRINLFWLEKNPGDPREQFFPRIWALFEDLSPRLHWAKLVPLDARAAGRTLAPSFAHWQDFLRVRAELDPDGLFLT
ncbi:MAG: D-arabinono-1,4-lactone oxidase, partial [Polyangiaceae bacterium]